MLGHYSQNTTLTSLQKEHHDVSQSKDSEILIANKNNDSVGFT